jgi:SgrR family transcriptional regulator
MNRLVDPYLRLADGLPPRSSQRLDDVAARLCCGERNARLMLGRMQALGWLTWTAGRGRGRLSTLELHEEPERLRLSELHRLLHDGDLEAAFSDLPPSARARLRQALPSFLGATPGNGLRMPFYRPLHALDPIRVTRRTEAHLVSQLCPGLTGYDLEREAVAPALAHHWEVSAGGRHWRFWLRRGLTFHDGRPVRAADAAASLTRLRDTPGPYRALFAHVAGIATEGDRLDLQLDADDHLLPNRLAHHAAAVLPSGDWRRTDFASRPVGTGAFRLVRNNEHRATLQRFDGYWRERALLDEIDLWVVPPGSALPPVDLRLGASTPALAPEIVDASRSPWQRIEQAEQGCDMVLLNPARAAFASAAARVAVGHWLRAHVAAGALGASHRLARGFLPGWHHLPAPPAPARVPPPLLPRRLRLVTYELAQHRALAVAVQAACAEAGCVVDIDVQPFPVFERQAWRHGADVVVAGEVLHDDLALGQFFTLADDLLIHAWLPAGLRRMLDARCREIAAEPDASCRAAAMEAAFALLVRQGAFLPMRHTVQRLEHAPHLGGVTLARSGWMDFRSLWLSES